MRPPPPQKKQNKTNKQTNKREQTFDGLPVVVAVAAGRRELGVVVVGLPHVDVRVLRAADDVLSVVAAKQNTNEPKNGRYARASLKGRVRVAWRRIATPRRGMRVIRA